MRPRLGAVLLLCVTATPPTVLAEQHPHLAKGFDPNGVYHFNDIDSINAFNGNLTVTIPIGQEYSIGGGLTYHLRLYANGKVWDHEERIDLENEQISCGKPLIRLPCVSAFPNRRSNAGLGWTMSLGRLFPSSEETNGSGFWEYESPDGGVHRFYDRFNGAYATTDTKYTNDGTYLRLTKVGNQYRVDFPNGEVHTFEPDDDPSTSEDDENDELAPWLLKHIGNQFKPAALTVNYTRAGGVITGWTITDGWRSHSVALERMPFESGLDELPVVAPNWGTTQERMLVSTVTVAAFNGTRAQYTFNYTPETLERPAWDTIPGAYNDTWAPVQLLSSLVLPDGTSYSFGYYREGLSGTGGCLREMVLPTRGKIAWEWGSYSFPERGESSENPWTADRQPGIAKRHVYAQNDTLIGTWQYVSSSQPPSSPPQTVRWIKTTVTDPSGAKTENFFDTSAAKATHATYGLPYNPLVPDPSGTRFLSQRLTPGDVSNGAGQPVAVRETYVRYELDPGTDETHRNARVASSRTRYNAGDPLSADDDETFDIDKDRFDGYGHYRVVKETVDKGQATEQVRTTTTNFNPGRGLFPSTQSEPFVLIQPGASWITGTYDSITKADAVGTEITRYCFDPANGALLRKRNVRNLDTPRKDLVTSFDYDRNTGDLQREQYFGGDTLVPEVFDTSCEPQTGVTPPFEVVHTYAAGSRATSKYSGVNYKSLDLAIDANTGFPRSSRDPAGVVTTFIYDVSSRLTEVRPEGSAWSHYEYTPASGTTVPASVSATQWPELASQSPGHELTHVRYHYDGIGRMVQESRRMPDGWAVSSSRYDALDQRTETYPPVYKTSSAYVASPSGQATRWTYDRQGRVTVAVQPDGSRTDIAYKLGTQVSSRGKRTTSRVATKPPGSQGDAKTDVTVEEKTDAFGRLVQVTENAGGTAPPVTNYTYDVESRLRTITMGGQTRIFEYDGAGLLKSEKHPETNDAATTFTYDARGHLKTRTTPTATVTFEYDKAERLIRVSGPGGTLKEFFFDRPNDALAKGKLDRAIRYNRHPNLAGGLAKVEEKFHYEGPGGRMSRKVTTVTIGADGTAPVEKYEFSEGYEYGILGETSKIIYPGCTQGCGELSAPVRTVKTDHLLGLPSAVTPYVSGVAYAPAGAVTELRHLDSDGGPGPIYRQDVDTMGRPVKIEVSKFCEDLSSIDVAVSPAGENLPRGTQVTITATPRNAAGGVAAVSSWLWYERGATGDVELPYTTNSIQVEAGDATSYFAKASNDTCSADSPVVVIVSCDAAGATISAPDQVTASETIRAYAPGTTGAIYQWGISGGTLIEPTNTSFVDFVPACAGPVLLSVEVTTACGTATDTKPITVQAPRAFVGGSKTITQPGLHEIAVALQGQGPWTVQWQDLAQPETYHSSPAVRQVMVSGTTSYTVTSATDVRGCPLMIAAATATITMSAQCTAPAPAISTTVQSALASKRVSVRTTAPWTSYFWTATNARIDSSTQDEQIVTFVPGCSGSVDLTVTVTNSCGGSGTASATIPIIPPSADVVPSTLTYVPGETPAQLDFTFAGAVPELTWSDGFRETKHSVTDGLQSSRPVTPTGTTTYRITEIRDAAGCTGTTTGQSLVEVCPGPPAVISAPARVVAYTNNAASVPETAGAAYQWSILNGTGTLVSGSNTSSAVFRSACSLPVKLKVTVSADCGVASTSTIDIPVDSPTATLTGSATITQGSSTTLTVALSGPGPWTVTWADIGTQSVTALPYTRTVQPDSTTTYKLTGMTTAACAGTVSGEAAVTVVMAPPGNVVAEAISATAVRVQWTYSGVAEKFDVYRNGQRVGSANVSPFNDTGLPTGTAHVYKVVAVKGLSASAPSATDLATAIGFTRTITPASFVMAADITETRTAINAVRTLAGLPLFSFTDPSLVGIDAKAVHVTELRTALAQARTALGLPAVAYANPGIIPSDTVTARDVTDARAGVR